jgi:uncharacterized protein (TIGR00369 family)
MTDQEKHFEIIRQHIPDVGPIRTLGIELEKLEAGRAVLTMDPHSGLVHDFGIHGGIMATLADTAAAVALMTKLPLDARLATVEMKINYLSPHLEGILKADARVLRLGKRLGVGEVEVFNGEGELLAKSLLTFSIRPGKETAAVSSNG